MQPWAAGKIRHEAESLAAYAVSHTMAHITRSYERKRQQKHLIAQLSLDPCPTNMTAPDNQSTDLQCNRECLQDELKVNLDEYPLTHGCA